MTSEEYMAEALAEAEKALALGEVPVGAVIVWDGEIVGRGHNSTETDRDATRHAEIAAIEDACRNLGGWRLWKGDMYVTLEPCPMCAGAAIKSRIRKVYYGARDPKNGAFGSVTDLSAMPFNHRPEIIPGIMEKECSQMLSEFFSMLRSCEEDAKKEKEKI